MNDRQWYVTILYKDGGIPHQDLEMKVREDVIRSRFDGAEVVLDTDHLHIELEGGNYAIYYTLDEEYRGF